MKENHVKLLFKHNAFEGDDIESAWATKEGNFYRLDNILFYAKEYSWGDKIKAEIINGELYAEAMVEESGHSTIRILFSGTEGVEKTRDELKNMGCDSELSNFDKLVSFDIPPAISYAQIISFLNDSEEEAIGNIGKLAYQVIIDFRQKNDLVLKHSLCPSTQGASPALGFIF